MGEDLEKLGEFGIVGLFREMAGARGEGAITGIGDDCAVLAGPGDMRLLVTTDMLVERVHFLRDRITPCQLGWKSLAVNVSDIAAMGGRPAAAFLALGLTPGVDRPFLEGFREGLFACAEAYRLDILGGDTVASRADLVTCLTVLGLARAPVLRSTACVGDGIFVGRALGASPAGLRLLLDPPAPGPDDEALLKAHLEPLPQVELGRLLGDEGLASAMIDVSDGVAGDLGHLCAESGVGAVLEAAAIPLDPGATALADRTGEDALAWALHGGEEYCLLFTLPPGREQEARVLCAGELGVQLHRIGEIVAGAGVELRRAEGVEPLARRGHDHFGG